MAYNPHNLSLLAHANGFTLWHYRTTDPADRVESVGYFGRAVDMLRVGDMVMANFGADGTSAAGIFLVMRSSADVVELRCIGN